VLGQRVATYWHDHESEMSTPALAQVSSTTVGSDSMAYHSLPFGSLRLQMLGNTLYMRRFFPYYT